MTIAASFANRALNGLEHDIVHTLLDFKLDPLDLPVLTDFLLTALKPNQDAGKHLVRFQDAMDLAMRNAPARTQTRGLWTEAHFALIAAISLPPQDSGQAIKTIQSRHASRKAFTQLDAHFTAFSAVDGLKKISAYDFQQYGETVSFLCELIACLRCMTVRWDLEGQKNKDGIPISRLQIDQMFDGFERYRDVVLGNPDKRMAGTNTSMADTFRQLLVHTDELRIRLAAPEGAKIVRLTFVS